MKHRTVERGWKIGRKVVENFEELLFAFLSGLANTVLNSASRKTEAKNLLKSYTMYVHSNSSTREILVPENLWFYQLRRSISHIRDPNVTRHLLRKSCRIPFSLCTKREKHI